jgi:hypothetical protein
VSDTRKIQVYPAKDGWRWRKIVSSDITANSTEPYEDKGGAEVAAVKEAEGTDFIIEVVDEDPFADA